MIVSKFGGTSVANAEAMKRCAEIVASNPERKIIVISAISGVTNALVQLSSLEISSNKKEEILREIEQRHLEIIAKLSNPEAIKPAFLKLYSDLRLHLDYTGRDRRWADTLLAFGERMSTAVFIQFLLEKGLDAELISSTEWLKTDSYFGNAQPDLEAIKRAVKPYSGLDKVFLTQGFVGSDSFETTTTLGRGGSDLSAALFAEAFGADTLEIWTDVAGVFTTDPRITPNARPIYEISFEEAAELSVFGGKVLHPATLKPAIRAGVKVRVASSLEPDSEGTWIVDTSDNQPAVRAISLRKGQTLLTVNSLQMLHQPGFLAQLFSILAEFKISVDLVTTSEVSVALTLDTGLSASNKVYLSDEILAKIGQFADVQVEEGLSLVAIIGNKLERSTGLSGKLFTALANQNIRLICYGASSHNLCFLVDENEAMDVVRIIHREFIEKSSN